MADGRVCLRVHTDVASAPRRLFTEQAAPASATHRILGVRSMLYPPLILTSVTINIPNWLFATNTLIGIAIGLIIGLLLGRLRRWA